MTVDELIRSAERRVRRETEEQTRKETEKQIREQDLRLAARMVEAGEADKIPRLQQEPEFLQQMLEKYHL